MSIWVADSCGHSEVVRPPEIEKKAPGFRNYRHHDGAPATRPSRADPATLLRPKGPNYLQGGAEPPDEIQGQSTGGHGLSTFGDRSRGRHSFN